MYAIRSYYDYELEPGKERIRRGRLAGESRIFQDQNTSLGFVLRYEFGRFEQDRPQGVIVPKVGDRVDVRLPGD